LGSHLVTLLASWRGHAFNLKICYCYNIYNNFDCFSLFSFLYNVTATTLTSWHLIVTFCTLHAAQRFHLFDAKAIDMKTVMLFGILNGVSIGLLNLSLGFNSIGFYQVHLNFTATWDFQSGLPSLSSLLDLHPGGVFLLYIADDQTCNHTIHCPIGNSVPEKAIQVSTTIYTHTNTLLA